MGKITNVILTGVGGQGILLASEIISEAAALAGNDVKKSEVHGMAQRGGAVISMVKVGPFRGPLIAAGRADLGLFLQVKKARADPVVV